jgi:16S rRNA (cytosine1402-N4)-methyltransferase
MSDYHEPVLKEEVLQYLNFKEEGIIVDATLGDGGHSERLLQSTSPGLRIIGVDRDPEALQRAQKRLSPFGDRIIFANNNYSEILRILEDRHIQAVDGILMDLGVSSPQLDTPRRGFSFMKEGFLDMRMSQDEQTTAADLLKNLSDAELVTLFKEYGEERYARRAVRAIRKAQAEAPIESTLQLSKIICSALPYSRSSRIHPATRIFQALRIAVNQELDHLRTTLEDSLSVLKAGGRLVVISFHSLEDRIVKHFFRDEEKGCICPPKIPLCVCGRKPRLKVLTRRVVVPKKEEVAANPRASSSKMRVAERVYV